MDFGTTPDGGTRIEAEAPGRRGDAREPPLRVVCLGAGGSWRAVLRGLRRQAERGVRLSVTAAVFGGDQRSGARPGRAWVGEVRRALAALSGPRGRWSDFFGLPVGPGRTCAGDLVLLDLLQRGAGLAGAARSAARALACRGLVLPVTAGPLRLAGAVESGGIVSGERELRRAAALRRVWLDPCPAAAPGLRDLILAADVVALGPAPLFTRLIPALLVEGVAQALADTAALPIVLAAREPPDGPGAGLGPAAQREALAAHTGVHPEVLLCDRADGPGERAGVLSAGAVPIEQAVRKLGAQPMARALVELARIARRRRGASVA